jgi:energy-coupling factor transporter ATP-binding protein EcfA2
VKEIEHTYYLPDENGIPIRFKTRKNALFIIGANGSGKSKLGAWMEVLGKERCLRVSAQKSLEFDHSIKPEPPKPETDKLQYGQEFVPVIHDKNQHSSRWGDSRFDEFEKVEYIPYTETLLEDFDHVLTLLITKSKKEGQKPSKCKDKNKPAVEQQPVKIIDEIYDIWKSIFPHVKISFENSTLTATVDYLKYQITYSGRRLSDGEKVALYYIAQALCLPKGHALIIDEPEGHLHRSIINKLWAKIEARRPDIFFIYITQDTQFAANHLSSEKVWTKKYIRRPRIFDKNNLWEYEKVEPSEIPEDIHLEILGSREPIIFASPIPGSHDHKLLSAIYSNYYVVPCYSSDSVIEYTKAAKNDPQLADLEIYGLIHSGFRSKDELESLEKIGVYHAKVQSIVNLFLTSGIVETLHLILTKDRMLNVKDFEKLVIDDIFLDHLEQHIYNAAVNIFNDKLEALPPLEDDEEFDTVALDNLFDDIKSSISKAFYDAAKSKNYDEILLLLKDRNVVATISKKIKLEKSKYQCMVRRLLMSNPREPMIAGLRKYLPPEIPIK